MSRSPAEIERVLAIGTVRGAPERSALLTAVRDLGRADVEFGVDRLEGLIRVVDHFQALLLYGQLEFLRQPFGDPDTDRDFALTVQRICLEAANGFQRFLRNRASWARTRDAIEMMYQVTGLALSAIHCSVKWGYFLDESARPPWKQMHALYALADADGYAQVPFVLHASQPDFQASVQSLYLEALLLGLLNSGSLTKGQIEIADGWLAGWCREYSLVAPASEPNGVCVDLASDAGLRIADPSMRGEDVRQLRADALKGQIVHLQSELAHGRLHAERGAGSAFPIEEHTALLAIVEKLQETIVSGGEARVDRRTTLDNREVDVAIGIDRAMRKMREAPAPATRPDRPAVAQMEMIEVSETGLSALTADPQIAAATVEASAADPEVERWRVHDLSSRGFGLLVDRAAAEAVPLNAIVSLRNQEKGGWIVGTVVRKQPSRGRGEVLVGVEVLAYRPIPVDLQPQGAATSVRGLFLPGPDAGGRLDSLLLPLGDFRVGGSFTVRSGAARYGVRLNRVVRKGADWINARFEVESKK